MRAKYAKSMLLGPTIQSKLPKLLFNRY